MHHNPSLVYPHILLHTLLITIQAELLDPAAPPARIAYASNPNPYTVRKIPTVSRFPWALEMILLCVFTDDIVGENLIAGNWKFHIPILAISQFSLDAGI